MKIKILMFLLLFATSIRGADYLDSLNEVRSYIKQNLNWETSTSAESDSVITKNIKEAILLLCPAVAARQSRDTIYTVAHKIDYPIDTNLLEISKVFMRSKDTLKPLIRATVESFSTLFTQGSSYTLVGQRGILAHPGYYDWAYVTDSGYIRLTLYPIPVLAGDTIIIDGKARIKNIESDSSIVGQLPITYRPLVVNYVTAKIAKYKGKDALAEWYWNLFLYQAAVLDITVNAGIKQ